MRTLKTRPRIRSGEPRWTSTALQTTAAPFPIPATTTKIAATQTFGDTAASRKPAPMRAIPTE